jgi:hypothetical protein
MDEIEHEAGVVAGKLAATDAASLPRIEIVEERQRVHDAAFRARVVAASLSRVRGRRSWRGSMGSARA